MDETERSGRFSGTVSTLELEIDAIRAETELFLAYLNEEVDLYLLDLEREMVVKSEQRLDLFLVLAALALFLFLAFSFLLRQLFSSRMTPLIDGAVRLENADLGHRIRLEVKDEFGTLANAFNHMARVLETKDADLKSHIAELDQANREIAQARDKLESRVRERTLALKRSNEELQQFAYVASHDLQEPLNVIDGYLNLLAEDYKGRLSDDADEFIAHIQDSVLRMKALIRDLLSFSRVDSQGKPFERADLNDVLAEALANLKARIEETGAEVKSANLPVAEVDSSQMVRVFQNLIGNALKFQQAEARPEIQIVSEQQGEEWVIAVRDNGIGISETEQGKIFVIFQRLHPRHDYEGTGIGLSICKRIIERHHGRIWVKSEPGKGSEFIFALPVSK